jgi:hypothetical protein
LCLSVEGMGDLNAGTRSELAHVKLLQKYGAARPETLVQYRSPFPDGSVFEIIYLDDRQVTQVLPRASRDEKKGRWADEALVAAGEEAYRAGGLLRAEDKAFRFQERWRCLGTDVNAGSGVVASPAERRGTGLLLGWGLASARLLNKKLLQKFLGVCEPFFGHRPECRAAGDRIHRYIANLPDKGMVSPPPWIREELFGIAMMGPVAYTNVRWGVSSDWVSVDATPRTGGSTEVHVGEEIGRLLVRKSERAGFHTRVLSAAELALGLPKDQAPPGEEEGPLPNLEVSELSDALRWRGRRAYDFRRASHINGQELRSVAVELKDWATTGEIEMVRPTGADSRVSIGAIAKGRSGSRLLTPILQDIMVYSVLGRQRLAMVWIRSGSNSADAPSRALPIPPPRPAKPWVAQLLRRAGGSRTCPEDTTLSPWDDAAPGSLHPLAPAWQSAMEEESHWWSGGRRRLPREYFAGSGRLTLAWERTGLRPLPPFEAFPDGECFRGDQDLRRPWVAARERLRGRRGEIGYGHFAIPSGTLGAFCRFPNNACTRTPLQPRGTGSSHREDKANILVDSAVSIAEGILEGGGQVTFSHPWRSFLWDFPGVRRLQARFHLREARAEMCAFNLTSPEGGLVPKPMRFLTSVPELAEALARRCGGCGALHTHAPEQRGRCRSMEGPSLGLR